MAKIQPWRFFDSRTLPEIAQKADRLPHLALLKVEEPIAPQQVTFAAEPMRLPLMRIHYAYSAGILFGYMVEIPLQSTVIAPTLVRVVRPSEASRTKYTDVRMLLQNAHIAAFHSEDGAGLVCFNEHHVNLSADVLKGSGG